VYIIVACNAYASMNTDLTMSAEPSRQPAPTPQKHDHGKPLVLLILDGWGWREAASDNAISEGDTPNWDRLLATAPHSLLQTSGAAVGLPDGQMGNSEVGHFNIGAGRLVMQELQRINQALHDGVLLQHAALRAAVQQCAENQATVHVVGLLSAGGVHSHEDHLLTLLPQLQQLGAHNIAVHAITDGRDCPPRSALPSMHKLEQALAQLEHARLASVSGRFYAMDRDQRWERTEQAWQAIVTAQSERHCASGHAAIEQAYALNENDEFITPTVIADGCPIEDGDMVLCYNFRGDRMRQLASALAEPGFKHCCQPQPRLCRLVTFTSYREDLPALVLFPPQQLQDLFGAVIARAGMRQLRLAETEKYAHVTFFFNGGSDQPFPGEDRILVPSPKVRTYDLQPEMSAAEVGRHLTTAIHDRIYDVIICNVANPDMVGHTGHFAAALQAVAAVDHLLGEVLQAIAAVKGQLLVTADHGNIEQMLATDGAQQYTSHTVNPVPLVYAGPQALQLQNGALCDVAPTMLALLGLEQPAAMTGHSLVSPLRNLASA